MTMGEWLSQWLLVYVEPSGRLADSTKAQYARSVAAVPPWLASVALSDLSALDCMRWLNEVARTHPRAAQLDRVMLSRALLIAGKLGLCQRGIIDPDTCPTPDHKPREALVLTAEQCVTYIQEARKLPEWPLLMLCLCGLRRGEALGMRWEHVDLQAGTIAIVGQRLRVRGRYAYTALKTPSSCRTLLLPDWMVDELRCVPRRLRSPWVLDCTPERLHRAHRSAILAAGLPDVTLHGLRHTMASLAAAGGVPMKHLQNALGHAKIGLTADLYAAHQMHAVQSATRLVWQGFAGGVAR